MFVNRKDELNVLDKEYKSKNASFSVIYGRRRVGKTALISEYIKNKPHIYLYATEGNLTLQLENFSKDLMKMANLPYIENAKFKNFEEAFGFIEKLKLNKRLVLAIDEYQNLCKLDKSFSSMLQKVWDLSLCKQNIHLILCGSVISMMHSQILSYSAPLYGRRTSNIHLKALKFAHIKDFLPQLSKVDLMNVFASFGTIPKYLQLYENDKSFMQNIKDNILDKNSYLYSEGNFLLKLEINDVKMYFSILESISKGNTKIGSIASNLSVHSSYLPQYINRLIELDFITKEVPITEKNPLKSKLGRYKIKDKFINFWFYYVYKNYNYLEINQSKAVLDEIKTNFNDRFVSFAFEDFIYEQILQNPKKYLGFTPLKLGRWWNNQEEIGLVAMDEQNIAFIECKWQNNVDKQKVLKQLKQKSKCVDHDKNEKFLVFTKEDYLA